MKKNYFIQKIVIQLQIILNENIKMTKNIFKLKKTKKIKCIWQLIKINRINYLANGCSCIGNEK